MFDFGWAELFIVGAIALFVIGPQDIPKIAYSVGQFFRRIKYFQYTLTSQFDDFMEKAEAKAKPKTADNDDDDDINEADADADLLDIMPLPPAEPSLREGEADEAIQKSSNRRDSEAQSK